jgi:hypothetical protein
LRIRTDGGGLVPSFRLFEHKLCQIHAGRIHFKVLQRLKTAFEKEGEFLFYLEKFTLFEGETLNGNIFPIYFANENFIK